MTTTRDANAAMALAEHVANVVNLHSQRKTRGMLRDHKHKL